MQSHFACVSTPFRTFSLAGRVSQPLPEGARNSSLLLLNRCPGLRSHQQCPDKKTLGLKVRKLACLGGEAVPKFPLVPGNTVLSPGAQRAGSPLGAALGLNGAVKTSSPSRFLGPGWACEGWGRGTGATSLEDENPQSLGCSWEEQRPWREVEGGGRDHSLSAPLLWERTARRGQRRASSCLSLISLSFSQTRRRCVPNVAVFRPRKVN